MIRLTYFKIIASEFSIVLKQIIDMKYKKNHYFSILHIMRKVLFYFPSQVIRRERIPKENEQWNKP